MTETGSINTTYQMIWSACWG